VSRPAIAVLGSGRAAKTIVAQAELAGFRDVRVAARSFARAGATAAARMEARAAARPRIRAVRTFADAVRGTAYVVLAVSDPAIASVARRLAEEVREGWKDRTVLHLSGALGPEPLAALARRGARVGALHLLTVFGTPPAARVGIGYRVDGSASFRKAAREFASMLRLSESGELRPRPALDDAGRARYHAAAALVANDLAALLEDGVEVFGSLGIPRRDAERALARLAGDAALALGAAGPRRGLTGPVVRGDTGTVRRHLEALGRIDPELAEIHRLLSLRLVRLALEGKRITAARGAALRRVLGGPRPRRGV
jgi:predicted short-subunit dehydrogenase-like oxidoreductase (DUF2520 family)